MSATDDGDKSPSSSITTNNTSSTGLSWSSRPIPASKTSTPSFGLYTQRSPTQRAKLALPRLNPGSKRTFSYVLDTSQPTRFSFTTSTTTSSTRPSRFAPIKNRFFPSPFYLEDDSSDSSMLSVTPPRSEPTASSSPALSSSQEDLHDQMRRRRGRRHRKHRGIWRSKKRNSGLAAVGGSDCWNHWRGPTSAAGDLSDGGPPPKFLGNRRRNFGDDDDSSEEGHGLKKARVTERVFEVTTLCHRKGDKCNCASRRGRRTASLSPGRRRLGRRRGSRHCEEKMVTDRSERRPMRFRMSLLGSGSTSKDSNK